MNLYVRRLLSFEETRAHEEEDGKELVALLSTLSVFSMSYPELLVPHIDTLLIYLKGDNGAKKYETVIVSTVSCIVSLSSPHFGSAELARLAGSELPTDLVKIAYRVIIATLEFVFLFLKKANLHPLLLQFPPSAVSSAVEALAKLANHPAASSADNVPEKKLFNMALQFYSYLLKNRNKTANFSTMKKAIFDNIRRALSALGSICRFHECKNGVDNHNLDPNGFSVIIDIKKLQFSGNVLSNCKSFLALSGTLHTLSSNLPSAQPALLCFGTIFRQAVNKPNALLFVR